MFCVKIKNVFNFIFKTDLKNTLLSISIYLSIQLTIFNNLALFFTLISERFKDLICQSRSDISLVNPIGLF